MRLNVYDRSNVMRRFVTHLPLLVLAGICGCSSLSESFSSVNPFAKQKLVIADADNPAVEVACIWQPGEGPGMEGVPARGFSGQIFFFTRHDAEPALVNGTVRVYLFADKGTPEERGKPLRQFDFTPEDWTTHASMTALGPGYSVFVPYPDPEAYQVRCQLRVRFTPAEGRAIWSEALTMILEGPPRPGNEPKSWGTPEAHALVGQGNHIQVTTQHGSVAELNKDRETMAAAPRKLRSDTYAMPELQQVSYETPAGRNERSPARSSEPVSLPKKGGENSRKRLGTSSSGHPLQATPKKSESAHPLAATASEPWAGENWHPPTRVNAATLDEPTGFPTARTLIDRHKTPPSHPLLQQDVTEAGPAEREIPDLQPLAGLQTAVSRRLSDPDHEFRRPTYIDATPVLGGWQSGER
jgi:hypothetical protein